MVMNFVKVLVNESSITNIPSFLVLYISVQFFTKVLSMISLPPFSTRTFVGPYFVLKYL